MPRILLLDIETAPHLAHVWKLWKENVGINQLMLAGYTLSFAAKWLGSSRFIFDSLPKSGTKGMVQHASSLMDEADMVVTWNGRKFDIPTLNKEIVLAGLPPPSPFKQIDLLETAKKQFRFASNKLDFVAQALGVGKKVEHEGHELWVRCMAGDAAAWRKMERYNIHDVRLLEGVYYRLRPWVRQHPNVGTYDEAGVLVCPACGSPSLQRRGYYRTDVNKYVRLRCNSCFAWSREAFSEFNRDDRANLARVVPLS